MRGGPVLALAASLGVAASLTGAAPRGSSRGYSYTEAVGVVFQLGR